MPRIVLGPRPQTPPGSLLLRVQELIDQAREQGYSYVQIAEHCEVPYLWLQQIGQRTIDDPSVNRIQKVYEGLTNTKLQLL